MIKFANQKNKLLNKKQKIKMRKSETKPIVKKPTDHYETIKVKEFNQSEFESKIDLIINQLGDKDCQRVEFTRGRLAVYRELVGNHNGWIEKKVKMYDFF